MPLPVEIIADILSRLPVKILKRFRCVSKSWCKEIDSPYFINMHLQKSLQNLGLVFRDRKDSTKLYTVDLDKPNPTSVELFTGNMKVTVIGSCNGLLALLHYDDDSTISLYNPRTREHKILPFSPVELLPVPSDGRYEEFFMMETHLGFGYDPFSEDYKIVRITNYNYPHARKFFPEVKVYSLKSNSWNRIKESPYYYILSRHGEFANGSVHWQAVIGPDHWEYLILAFDFGVDGFRIIPEPKHVDKVYDYFTVKVLGGCLCLVYNNHNYNKYIHAQIWVMKEYGVRESWSKLCSTFFSDIIQEPFRFYMIVPLVYSKTEDKVLFELDHKFFVWYDLKKKTSELVKIEGPPVKVSTAIFVGSLVTLNSGGGGGACSKEKV